MDKETATVIDQAVGGWPKVSQNTHNALTYLVTGMINLSQEHPYIAKYCDALNDILMEAFPSDSQGNFRMKPNPCLDLSFEPAEEAFEVGENETELEAAYRYLTARPKARLVN